MKLDYVKNFVCVCVYFVSPRGKKRNIDRKPQKEIMITYHLCKKVRRKLSHIKRKYDFYIYCIMGMNDFKV